MKQLRGNAQEGNKERVNLFVQHSDVASFVSEV